MPAATRKGLKKPWGNRMCARSSMPPASEPIRQACAGVVVRCALRERAARGIAAQPPRLQVAHHDPFAAEIGSPEQSAARIQRAASDRIHGQTGARRLPGRNAVERLVRFRIGPGLLDEYGGGDRAAAANDRGEAQVGLRAPIPVEEVAPRASSVTGIAPSFRSHSTCRPAEAPGLMSGTLLLLRKSDSLARRPPS